MFRTLGRSVGRSRKGMIGLGMAAGTGMAIASANPIEKTRDAALEFVFNDPNIDQTILGRDMSFSELFPFMPKFDMSPIPDAWSPVAYASAIRAAASNPTLVGDAFMDYKDTDYRSLKLAQQHVEQGYTNAPFANSIYPYSSGVVHRGVAASGDMVFGMYNTRMN